MNDLDPLNDPLVQRGAPAVPLAIRPQPSMSSNGGGSESGFQPFQNFSTGSIARPAFVQGSFQQSKIPNNTHDPWSSEIWKSPSVDSLRQSIGNGSPLDAVTQPIGPQRKEFDWNLPTDSAYSGNQATDASNYLTTQGSAQNYVSSLGVSPMSRQYGGTGGLAEDIVSPQRSRYGNMTTANQNTFQLGRGQHNTLASSPFNDDAHFDAYLKVDGRDFTQATSPMFDRSLQENLRMAGVSQGLGSQQYHPYRLDDEEGDNSALARSLRGGSSGYQGARTNTGSQGNAYSVASLSRRLGNTTLAVDPLLAHPDGDLPFPLDLDDMQQNERPNQDFSGYTGFERESLGQFSNVNSLGVDRELRHRASTLSTVSSAASPFAEDSAEGYFGGRYGGAYPGQDFMSSSFPLEPNRFGPGSTPSQQTSAAMLSASMSNNRVDRIMSLQQQQQLQQQLQLQQQYLKQQQYLLQQYAQQQQQHQQQSALGASQRQMFGGLVISRDGQSQNTSGLDIRAGGHHGSFTRRTSQPYLSSSWGAAAALAAAYTSTSPNFGTSIGSDDGMFDHAAARSIASRQPLHYHHGMPLYGGKVPTGASMPATSTLSALISPPTDRRLLAHHASLGSMNEFRDGSQLYSTAAGLAGLSAQLITEEIDEEGCPVIKVPRLPFRGSEGTMVIPHRLWKKGGNENIDSRHFTIMSYNVLAPHYVSLEKYSLTDPLYLNWEYRRERILDEICFYSPDFVCLQEVSPYDFKEYFLPTLQRLGYDGHFQLKKRDHAADGCATFYQESRFQLLAVQAFAYHDQIQGLDATADLKTRLQPFSNIALVCVFQNRQSPRSLRVRVVNTHFHWDPNYGDTKLLQAAILMEWLERTHRDVPTVIAADLNSKVGDPVLDYMVRGRVAPGLLFAGKDFGRFSGGGPWPLLPSSAAVAAVAAATVNGVQIQQQLLLQQQQQAQNQSQQFPALAQSPATTAKSQQVPQSPVAHAAGSAGSPAGPGHTGSGYHGYTGQPGQSPPFLLRHGTKLASAYDRRDLPFTNKTPDFCGSIDHILYTSGTLSIRDVLGDLIPVPSSGDAENASDEAGQAKLGGGVEATSAVTTPSPPLPAAESTQIGAASNSEVSSPPSKSVPTIERTGDTDVDAAAKVSESAGQELDPDLAGTTPTNAGPNYTPAPPPASTYLTRVQSLPARYYPSDHLPLIAVLKWKTVPILSSSNPTGLSVAGAGSRSRNAGAGGNKGMVGGFGLGGATASAAVPIPASVPATTSQLQNEVTYARVTTQGIHSGLAQHVGTGTTPPSALSNSLAAARAVPDPHGLGGSLGKR
ncbi:hypothetical protein BJ742DRAFT_814676 [Cladochytrium replicatum]|nr:hypothetical protein BJ742DRAFT_814676 [Cladochytrium replicatum]